MDLQVSKKQINQKADKFNAIQALEQMFQGQAMTGDKSETYNRYNPTTNVIDTYTFDDRKGTEPINSLEISEFLRNNTKTHFQVFAEPKASFTIFQPLVRRPNGTYVLNSRSHRTLEDLRKVNHVVGYRAVEIIPISKHGK